MKSGTRPKCLHCKELYAPDHRTCARQRFCSKPECRKASKVQSQQQWLGKAENKNYFKGPDHTSRVQRWRQGHPGYWRKGEAAAVPLQDALQDECVVQSAHHQPVEAPIPGPPAFALQDMSLTQPAVVVGLISILTGSTLQEDIARDAQRFLVRGRDILGIGLKGVSLPSL